MSYIQYRRLFSYGGNVRIFSIVEHHPKIRNFRIVHTKICTNEYCPLYGITSTHTVPPTANETPPDDGETPHEASVMSHDVVSGGEDDFSRDVLFSARRSLARGTPYLEGVRGQTRGTPHSEGVRGRSSIQNNRPLKFELDSSDED